MESLKALALVYDDLSFVARPIGWRNLKPSRAILWVPRGPNRGWRFAGYEYAGAFDMLPPPDLFCDWEVVTKEQWQNETQIKVAVF